MKNGLKWNQNLFILKPFLGERKTIETELNVASCFKVFTLLSNKIIGFKRG